MPLNDSALDVLADLETEGAFENLFVNRQTGKPYTTIMKVWSRLRLKAGLREFLAHAGVSPSAYEANRNTQ